MATNEVYSRGDRIPVAATDPATPASGDPCVFGQIPGVALINEQADGQTVIATAGVFMLPVKGTNAATGTAINPGDIVYYVAGNTPKLSVTPTGVRFGYALDAVGSGATATIRVKLGY